MHVLLIMFKSVHMYRERYVLSYLVVLLMNIIPPILRSRQRYLPTQRVTSVFPKARHGNPYAESAAVRLSFLAAKRGNSSLHQGERIRSRAHPPTSVSVRVPHGYVLVCLLPATGTFNRKRIHSSL